MRSTVRGLIGALVLLGAGGVSCVSVEKPAEPAPAEPGPAVKSRIVRVLSEGKPIFGIFSGPKTPEQAAQLAANRDIDFIFYSLEEGPFDLDTMRAYMNSSAGAMAEAGSAQQPIILRIPPIRDGREEARQRVHQALDAGVYAVVFPHVENGEEAALAVQSMRYQDATAAGPGGNRPAGVGNAPSYWGTSAEGYRQVADLWPLNPEGQLVNVLLIEDKEGIAHAREIVATEGVSIVFPGPGDLRRAYERDAEAVEAAIQTVLAACKEFNVICGITAGVNDIADRLAQGFRVIIVTEPEAIAAGRQAAGRVD